MKQEFVTALQDVFTKEELLINEPMSRHTSFRIGGNADYFVVPHDICQIQQAIALAKQYEINWFVLGNGSNLLVSDSGFRGLMIHIGKKFSQITVRENQITAQAGALLSVIGKRAWEESLSGFETLCGIPGTLGGAITMNAGAYGGEIKDVLVETVVLTGAGEIQTWKNGELELGYRTSRIQTEGAVVLSGTFALQHGDAAQIKEKMDEYALARRTKQPLEYPSAGSTFKRPAGYFAGKLIDDAGLRGYRVGDAQVSEKHCGFVINTGNATAREVLQLMTEVSDIVWEKYQVRLEPEVRLLGEF
ncbi:MAG: UDP-N-acetylmuramate dehydrogenase [Lachnospiraceae bacterium]